MLDQDVPTAWQESVAYAHTSIDVLLKEGGADGLLDTLRGNARHVVRSDDERWRWQWAIPDLDYVQKAGAAFHALAYALASKLPSKTGTTDYHEYLRSPEWKIRREWMLYLADYNCQLCSAKGSLHVHHRVYAHVGSELPCDLTVLCHKCHAKFHGKL